MNKHHKRGQMQEIALDTVRVNQGRPDTCEDEVQSKYHLQEDVHKQIPTEYIQHPAHGKEEKAKGSFHLPTTMKDNLQI